MLPLTLRFGQFGGDTAQLLALLVGLILVLPGHGHQRLLPVARGGGHRQARLSFLQGAGQFVLAGQLGVDLDPLPFQRRRLALDCLAVFGGPLLVAVPDADAQDLGQDFLAFVGRLGGEFVSLALQEKAGVGEDVVVHAQQPLDLGLGLAHAGLCFYLPAPLAFGDAGQVGVEFEFGRFAGSLAPDDAIERSFQFENKGHLGRGLVPGGAIDNVVVALDPALTEERPGDAIEDRRFARAVEAGDAG